MPIREGLQLMLQVVPGQVPQSTVLYHVYTADSRSRRRSHRLGSRSKEYDVATRNDQVGSELPCSHILFTRSRCMLRLRCEWFKLFLSPESLRSGQPDPRLPPLPAGKNVVDVISDFLRCIWRYAKRQITDEIGSVVDLDAADVLLTVPAAWDAAGCSLMREAAIRAGLVQSSRGGDKNWRDRLQIITEPEAGAIHASTLSTLHHLRPSQTFLICDAGGGTVDTAVYKLMGQLSQLEIAEMCVRSGANAGSLFIDLKFEELVRRMYVPLCTWYCAPI